VEDVKGLSYDILRKNFEGGNDSPHCARVILNYNIFHTPSPSVKGSSWALPLNLSPLLSLLLSNFQF